jgi:hypothetical protein
MEIGSAPQQQMLDMSLYLFDRPLHPELFQHYANYRVGQGNYYADVWITGLSHVVTINAFNQSLTEVIAPENDAYPSRGVLTRFRLKGERDHERKGNDGWLYLVSSQVETMDEALYKSVHLDLVRHANKGWCVTYDEWRDGEMAPFTYIDYEARDREFHLHAFHAFPHERTIIKTQSLFELPSGRN